MRSFQTSNNSGDLTRQAFSCLFLALLCGSALQNTAVQAQAKTEQLETDSGFTVSDAELEKERSRLLAAEKALLKELDAKPKTSSDADNSDVSKKSAVTTVSAKHESNKTDAELIKELNKSAAVQAVPTREPLAEETTLAAKKANLEAVRDSVEVTSTPSKVEDQIAEPAKVIETKSVETALPEKQLTAMADNSNVTDAKLESLRKINATLQSELKATRAQMASMQREMEESRSRLMISETEVDRLSGALRTRNNNTINKYISDDSGSSSHPVQMVASRTLNASAPNRQPLPPTTRMAAIPQPKPAEEVMVATVTAEKANLRTGPSKDNSPLMNVSQGTRLVVETRQGEWYRVVAPTGARAWVSSDVLGFGDTSQSSPTRTVNIAGYTNSAEDEAFQLIKRGASR